MNEQEKQQIGFAQAVKMLRENLNGHIELNQIQSKITRAKYLALVKEGFTEEQAIELCKA